MNTKQVEIPFDLPERHVTSGRRPNFIGFVNCWARKIWVYIHRLYIPCPPLQTTGVICVYKYKNRPVSYKYGY